MRILMAAALMMLGTAALAQDAVVTPEGGAATQVYVNVNTSISIPYDGAPDGSAGIEASYRKEMYKQSAQDCAELLETIAKTCALTNINVSTTLNQYPGQPTTISISRSTTLQIDLK